MARRREITMSPEELQAFLAEERIVTCATIGPNGRPHLMPLWYVMKDGLTHGWPYGTSQKVRNLGAALAVRYGSAPPGDPIETVRAAVLQRGGKRVVLRFHPTRIVTWDHRKLAGRH